MTNTDAAYRPIDVAIVGGGIVGLATALTLLERDPEARVTLFEKESDVATHQTGRNSGVIHSGIYYPPGSLKARYALAGSRSMVAFCERHGVPVDVCGKVIVATQPHELSRLDALRQRGLEHGLAVRTLNPEELSEVEPHATGLAALYVPSTGITDYGAVCRVFAERFSALGGTLQRRTRVERIVTSRTGTPKPRLETTQGDFEAAFVVNCGGLFSDRLAKKSGAAVAAQIVPFRGEYYELTPERRGLVNNLIYPVPNPDFPFLGVHFTRMIGGGVHAGPNAVLSLKREGYRKRDVDLGDLAEVLRYPGFWRLAKNHAAEGAREVLRSWSKQAFVRSLQTLVPEVQAADIRPAPAGVRAQALLPNGTLADDFLIVRGPQSLHICNAPSPAATASLEIARAVSEHVPRFGAYVPNQGFSATP